MKNIAGLVFYLYIYTSAFLMGLFGFFLFVIGTIGFFGVEVRAWSFHYYFGGLFLMLTGSLILYGMHLLTNYEEEDEVIYLGPGEILV